MRKDFENYLYSMADQVNKMNKALEEINKEMETNQIPQEVYENLQKQVDIISGNYQRLLYCKYLLDLRPKFIQKFFDKKQKKLLQKLIEKHADRKSVEEENNKALEEIEKVLHE